MMTKYFFPLLLILSGLLPLSSCDDGPIRSVRYKCYLQWEGETLPDFGKLGKPDLKGECPDFNLHCFEDSLDHFAVRFDAPLWVRRTEDYTFLIASNDGSRLYMDGELLIDNDGRHGASVPKDGTVTLKRGLHTLSVDYFDYWNNQSLYVFYSTPTIGRRIYNVKAQEMEEAAASDDSFVQVQAAEAFDRYTSWKGEDQTVCFPILTDMHTNGKYTYKHLGYAARVADMFGCDFMANLGDIGLNLCPANFDSVYSKAIINATRTEMEKYDGVWIYAPGNHDWDGGEGLKLDESFLSDQFQKEWEAGSGGNMHIVKGRTIGYYDIPSKKFRVIFLNSQGTGTREGKYYFFDDGQLTWLRSVLGETPQDVNVAVLSHYLPNIGAGRTDDISRNNIDRQSCEKLKWILSDFSATGRLAGMFSGDLHFNSLMQEGGLNLYVSQGYGGTSRERFPAGSKRAYFDYTKSLCIDIVAIKPSTGEIRTFRVGAGGEEMDYYFTYGDNSV